MIDPVVSIVVASIAAGIVLAWIAGHYGLKMYQARLGGSMDYEDLVKMNLENQERILKVLKRLTLHIEERTPETTE